MVAGADVVSYALTELGKPYVWGAEGPNTFDCSGLVEYVYQHFGLRTPRTTGDMMASGSPLQPVTRDKLQAGDLIFSNWEGARSSHVGIYDGSGSIIEAPKPGSTVTKTALGPNYWAHVDNLRRVPGVDGSAAGSTDPGVIGTIGAGISGLVGMIPNPGNVTEALTNLGNAMGSVASSAASGAKVAEMLTHAFLPSNIIRGVALMSGFVFILIGIWFLAREVKESN